MIEGHRSHPSIVAWTIFNEAWGQFDVDRVTDLVKRLDPSRLVNGHSGAANCCTAIEPKGGDVRDVHLYNGPDAPIPDRRMSFIGEFGGLAGRTPGHEWHRTGTADATGPIQVAANPSRAADLGLLRRQYDALEQEMRSPGLSGAVFTEYNDVETEFAGLITYDRRVNKIPAREVRKLNVALINASTSPLHLRPQRPAIPAGTRHYWKLDEGSGMTAHDVAGGLPLSLQGATWTRGHSGSALAFNGSGQKAVATGRAVDTTRSFTVSAWLAQSDRTQSAAAISQSGRSASGFSLGLEAVDDRPDLVPAYPLVLEAAPGPGTYPWRWSFAVPRSNRCAHPACFIRANRGYGDGTTSPREGIWQHVTGVVDHATRTSTLFINGTPVDNRIAEGVWNALGQFTVGAGQNANPGSDSFNGTVDQIRTYQRALSASEVRDLYRAGG